MEMDEVVRRYKCMIDDSNQVSSQYETGKRISPKFLKIGTKSIEFEYDLPIINYGNDMTKSSATSFVNKVLFN